MGISPLPAGWDASRATLQGYAHALTTFPRAAAPAHPRWNHVAMEPMDGGWVTAATPLADGAELVSALDLRAHRIVVRAGADVLELDIADAGNPRELARTIARLTQAHGSSIEIDADRVPDRDAVTYDEAAAEAFQASAESAVAAMRALNQSIEGEVTGPHLWPHGFDVSTEWFSPQLVEYDGSMASAQINLGWYSVEDGYLFSNPWPFDESFAATDLPSGAVWYRDSWEGAKWDIAEEIGEAEVTELGRRVHEVARPRLLG